MAEAMHPGDGMGNQVPPAMNIRDLIDTGEYRHALGVDDRASPLQIDSACARLSQEAPDLAGRLSLVAEVLKSPEKRKIYDIAYRFRDDVLTALLERFGTTFLTAVPAGRQAAWSHCQKLLRCDFALGDVRIRPRGASSLAQRGVEWVIESIAMECLPVVKFKRGRGDTLCTVCLQDVTCTVCDNARFVRCEACDGAGHVAGRPQLRIALLDLTDGPPAEHSLADTIVCAKCGGLGKVPCRCIDDYEFMLTRDMRAGDVIHGKGKRTDRTQYAVLDRKRARSPRPVMAIQSVYKCYELNSVLGRVMGDDCDYPLEYVESILRFTPVVVGAVQLALALVAGTLMGSWVIGVIVGIPAAIGSCTASRLALHPKAQRAAWVVTLLLAPFIGGFAGKYVSTWQSGAITGAILSAAMIALTLVFQMWQKKLR